jgi:hypothetical protein
MKHTITIQGKPVLDIYESFNGSYWYVTEKAWKQDSLIGRKVYKNDQILYGYVRLASYPDGAEFGYFSESELKSLGWRVWKVHRQNWSVCPGVEVQEAQEEADNAEGEGCGTHVPQTLSANPCKEVAAP